MVKTPTSLVRLGNEVVKWMDGQRDSQFPWCDTYLMWHDFAADSNMTTYNCTFPYWREHGNTILEDISIKGSFKEQIEKVVIVKPTEKGIMLPAARKKRQSIFILKAEKGFIPIILGKNYIELTQALEVTEYGLYSWKKNNYNKIFEGDSFSSGNVWNFNAHFTKGDLVIYVSYHDE